MAKEKEKSKQKQKAKEKIEEETKPLLEAPEEEKKFLAGDKKVDIEGLKKELEECQKLRDEYLAGWQRAKADFVNYKKEQGERIKEILEFAKMDLFLEMLKIHDNLERAREHIPEDLKDNEWVRGVLQIEDQFHTFFKEQEVEGIDPEGEKFDPNFHEAIEEIETEDAESGAIIEVVEKGYLLNGQLLRPAKVRVAKQPETEH